MILSDVDNIITECIPKLRQGSVRVAESVFRVLAEPLAATIPQPEFSQSTRDGFVIAETSEESDAEELFQITGEIPAGSTKKVTLERDKACRIMTGGLIPVGGTRVIPREDCEEQDGVVRISAKVLRKKNSFIQEEGSEIGRGEVVVSAGTVLLPEHVALLASVGHEDVPVYAKPRVGFFCTGSELVESPGQLRRGLKISSNRYLLEGLGKQFGAEVEYMGTVADTPEALQLFFQQLTPGKYDVLISTGGMGGGKYDLLEGAFVAAGGEVKFSGLNMRPGKSTLFGILGSTFGRTLFFGLPGPPTAVRALMNVIVGPTLLKMQGVGEKYPKTIQAYLQHSVKVKQRGVLYLKSGIVSIEDGVCKVRLAGNLEPPSCYLILPPERREYSEGALIDVYLTATPFSGSACL